MENDKLYWKNFYNKDKAPMYPSDFAVDTICYLSSLGRKFNVTELGAGNGRDASVFIDSTFCEYSGYDMAFGNFWILEESLKKTLKRKSTDVVYSRFFLHSITNSDIKKILNWTKKYFIAEFRIIGDEPKLYKNHERNLVNPNWFIKQLYDNNFEIISLNIGRGYAKYKNEDPLICRVIAIKK